AMASAELSTVLRHLRRRGASAAEAPTDRQLLERFVARRDGEAFALLVRRHGPMVLGVCRRVLRHAQDVEDAFQATFLVPARRAAGSRRGAGCTRSRTGWRTGHAARRRGGGPTRGRRWTDEPHAPTRRNRGRTGTHCCTRSCAAFPRSTASRSCSVTWRESHT